MGLQKGYERNYNFLIMKNWLYIEPYTLLFKTDKECLLYNTLDGSKLIIPVNGKNRDLLYALAEQKCIAISDTLADHQTLSDIIYNWLKYSGSAAVIFNRNNISVKS